MKKPFNWRELGRFCLYLFVAAAFITTNVLLLFNGIRVKVTWDTIGIGWFFTLLNIIGLSLAVWAIDRHRRRRMIDRPVRKIREGIDRITAGDLSVRIDKKGVGNAYQYGAIIDGINRMAAELGSVETLRTDFISNVSHEMKTPIAVLQNYATLLQTPGLDEDTRQDYTRRVAQETRRLASLITNILKLNKLENQRIFPKQERFDLTEQLCECMLSFEDLWEQKGLDIETDLEDSVTVEGDREMLSLVWNNLISNTVKFTPAGGTIGIAVKETAGGAAVRVTDTGCGMDDETAKNIFKKFYQGDTSHATQGNGLGLALAQRIVDIHGGTITVESAPGEGSVFTVTLWQRQGKGL